MRAALLVEPGRIELDDVQDPAPGEGDVLIAVGGVGLCGSDASVFSGSWRAPSYPWIMGHEAFGTIEATGAGVAASRVGEIVVVEPNIPCLACEPCRAGLTAACRERLSVGMNRQGALAEKLVVPSRNAWTMVGQSPVDLVCVEPTAVALAALRRLGLHPSDALVIGAGAQGLLMTLVLLHRDVEVHIHDIASGRVEFAETLGARPEAHAPATRSWSVVVDTVGSPASMKLAFERLREGGTVLVIGLYAGPMELSAQMIVRRQATVRGSLTYDHPADFEAATGMVGDGRLAPGRIVTEEYPLDATQQAFDEARAARGKTWIRVMGRDGTS